LDTSRWNTFLLEQKLRGDIDGRGGDSELTHGRINTAAIDTSADVEIEGTTTVSGSMKMWMLRVGKVRRDEAPSCTAINHGEKPPRMNAGMREAKMKFGELIRCNNLMHYMDESMMENVYVVRDWVLMRKPIPSTNITPERYSGSKRKKVENDKNADIDDDEAMMPPHFFELHQIGGIAHASPMLETIETPRVTFISPQPTTKQSAEPIFDITTESSLPSNLTLEDAMQQYPTLWKFEW